MCFYNPKHEHSKCPEIVPNVPWGKTPASLTLRTTAPETNTICQLVYQFSWLLEYWKRQWHPTPVLLPGKSYGRRSMAGCSPWGRWGSDMTEQLHFTFHFHALEKEMATHSSVLAWRISGMGEPGRLLSIGSQSRTRLKRCSSSGSSVCGTSKVEPAWNLWSLLKY